MANGIIRSPNGRVYLRPSGGVVRSTDIWPTPVDPGAGVLLFSATVENADTVPTLVNQEMSIGQPFKKGDVPVGSALRATIDGAAIPLQVSNRVNWSDGSLKHAQIRFLVPPSIAVGASKAIEWRRVGETWAAHDAPLHETPSAVTGKVVLDYNFTSWVGRNAAGTLTAQRGPKTFSSADLLNPANATWIERVTAGPVCSEWRASDMAKLAGGTADPHFGCWLYARAWGGTAGSPARIQFLFRTMYGWSDGVPADQQGIQCSAELRVNGTIVRGSPLGTSGWTSRNSYNGGFFASCGPTGKMDWYDVATGQFFSPPNLVYRHNIVYGIATKFFPPYDTDNPKYSPMTSIDYVPQARGTLSDIQDNVGEHTNLSWATSMPFASAMIAHARRPVAEVVSQAQVCRATAWGMAALGSIGYHRQTRKFICHLPTALNPDPAALGPSVWNGTKPQQAAGNLNPYVRNQDAPHMPQVCWWTYLTEGDQHWLDLVYMEAMMPGLFCENASGFFRTIPKQGGGTLATGGIYVSGQTRGVGHAARPLLNAIGIGHPDDPHHKMLKAMWTHFVEAREAHCWDQDNWRTSIHPNPDGRYFASLKMYPMDSSQEPQYKLWMHCFSLYSNSYGYGITEDAEAKRLATWWSHTPTVLSGGWHNDSDYRMKPDPAYAGSYYHIIASSSGSGVSGASNNDRRPWAYHGQWAGGPGPRRVTYKGDGQTLQFELTPLDGMVATVTGVHATDSGGGFVEPAVVSDWSKVPTGLVRGQVYYTVQASGNTCKLSTTLGGAPVSFATPSGADITGAMIVIQRVFGGPGHPMNTGLDISVDDNSYHVLVTGALCMYRHYVDPDDGRVQLAIQKMRALKAERGGLTDLRGLTTVPA